MLMTIADVVVVERHSRAVDVELAIAAVNVESAMAAVDADAYVIFHGSEFCAPGTLIHSTGKSCYRFISSSTDPSGLGQWCNMRYQGKMTFT